MHLEKGFRKGLSFGERTGLGKEEEERSKRVQELQEWAGKPLPTQTRLLTMWGWKQDCESEVLLLAKTSPTQTSILLTRLPPVGDSLSLP